MKFIELNQVPLFEQLELEEAILRSGTGLWCLINQGAPAAICMGISGKPQELIEPISTLPLIKRFSGGGCVVVDEETLFVTFIGDMEGATPSKIHSFAEDHLKATFDHLPFKLRENDYVLDDKKFGGNAQYITKSRFLHHSSLLWNWDPAKMSLLKLPAKRPQYRESRDHEKFLTPLHPHFESKEAFINKLLKSLGLRYKIEVPSTLELATLLAAPHRRALELVSR